MRPFPERREPSLRRSLLKILPATAALLSLSFSSGLAQDLSGFKLCIDPGHGGHNAANDRHVIPDPGTDFWESESNFRKALLLKSLMEEQGAVVLLTRNTNDYPNDNDAPSLSARVAFANTNNVDWFHSIHSNATGWVSNTTVNRTLMLVREKRSLTNPAASSGNGMGVPERQESWDLSLIMSPNIQQYLRTSSNQTWLDWTFYGGTNGGFSLGVLRGLLMPGELSEGSFHDFYPETRRLMTDSHRKVEAYALRNSFMQYLGVPADTLSFVYGLQSEVGTGRMLDGSRVRLLPEDTVHTGDFYHNGVYLFDKIVSGDHTLIFETPGYVPDTVTFTATAGSRIYIDRQLEPVGAPTTLGTTPVSGDSTGFLANQSVQIRFTKPMDTASVRGAFSIIPAVDGRLLWSSSNTVLTFDPDSVVFPFDVWFTLTIDSTARSASGFPLDGDGDGTPGDPLIITFRPKAVDAWAPAIEVFHPGPSDTLSSPLEVINLTFDEIIAPSSVTTTHIAMQQVGGGLQPLTFQTSSWNGRSGVNIFPTNGLRSDTDYRIRVYGIRDYAGNSIPTTETILWTFSVARQAYTREILDDFETGVVHWNDPESDSLSEGFDGTNTGWTSRQDLLLPFAGNTRHAVLSYAWDTTAVNNILRLSTDSIRTPLVAGHARIQVYVRGDGSGNSISFALRRTRPGLPSDEDLRSPSVPVTWIGWKLVEYPLDLDSLGQFLGDSASAGTVVFAGIDVRHGGPGSSLSGQLAFDDLQIARKIITGVTFDGESFPQQYTLHQNYPNPFNPATRISYAIPATGHVRLSVFDLLGREVAVIADGSVPAGSYEAPFDGANLPSGMYILQLRAENVRLTRKMMLLK